jgi:hypothetical protein
VKRLLLKKVAKKAAPKKAVKKAAPKKVAAPAPEMPPSEKHTGYNA